MDAVNYLNEFNRMCKTITSCSACPINIELGDGIRFGCGYIRKKNPKRVVEIVEKWSDKHPVKTYLQDFLEKCPNVEIYKTNDLSYPFVCRDRIYKGVYDGSCDLNCSECWNEKMK